MKKDIVYSLVTFSLILPNATTTVERVLSTINTVKIVYATEWEIVDEWLFGYVNWKWYILDYLQWKNH